MSKRIEWRTNGDGDIALVAVNDETNLVVHSWTADIKLLTNYLNEMDELATPADDSVAVSESDPERWGELIMARSDDGDVLSVDPQRYWENIGYLYRDRGEDPHPFHARS